MTLLSPRPLLATLTLLFVPAASPAQSGSDVREEEKLLKDAGLPTDGPALLKYFRDRTPTEANRARLAELVRQLGHRSFQVREKATRQLMSAGEMALPFLKPALKDADVEIARRAERCVAEITQVQHAARNVAAARLLAVRRPEGGAEALLAYLPFADWETVGEQLLDPLASVGIKGTGKDATPLAAVVAAATERAVSRRVAAAHVLGHAAAAHQKPLVPLLDDPEPLVRYHAAAALVRSRDKRGLPALIALLDRAPFVLSWRAEDLLYRLAGEQAPAPVAGSRDDPAVRKKWREAWEGWWKTNQDRLDLAKVNLDDASLGLTLFCEDERIGESPGFVFAVTRAGTVLWKLEGINSPADFHLLPGGRILVAENWHSKVTERDRQGKVLWERKLDDKPVSCERMPNGNTFVATYHSLHEFTPDGKEVFSHKSAGMLHGGYKQRDGHILTVDTNGTVVELDAKGAELHRFQPEKYASGAGNWASVEVLPSGRYLIALSGTNRVIETDRMGKVLWEKEVQTPTSATRLRNGHILVSSVEGGFVVEWDAAGNEVWRFKSSGRPFRVRRY